MSIRLLKNSRYWVLLAIIVLACGLQACGLPKNVSVPMQSVPVHTLAEAPAPLQCVKAGAVLAVYYTDADIVKCLNKAHEQVAAEQPALAEGDWVCSGDETVDVHDDILFGENRSGGLDKFETLLLRAWQCVKASEVTEGLIEITSYQKVGNSAQLNGPYRELPLATSSNDENCAGGVDIISTDEAEDEVDHCFTGTGLWYVGSIQVRRVNIPSESDNFNVDLMEVGQNFLVDNRFYGSSGSTDSDAMELLPAGTVNVLKIQSRY